jgi:hypothetical protein
MNARHHVESSCFVPQSVCLVCVLAWYCFREDNIKNCKNYLAVISFVISLCKNYYQNIFISEHTVTDHSQYNYLNPHHSFTLISWQLNIMKLTVVNHYNLHVQPCSNITSCWFCISCCIMEYSVYVNTICKVEDFCTLAVLLTHVLI